MTNRWRKRSSFSKLARPCRLVPRHCWLETVNWLLGDACETHTRSQALKIPAGFIQIVYPLQ